MGGESDFESLLNRRISRRDAISKTAKIAIGVGVAAVAAGLGGYYAYSTMFKPKAKIRVVAIAHAASGMKAVAEEDFMKAYPNIEVETLLFDWETGRDK